MRIAYIGTLLPHQGGSAVLSTSLLAGLAERGHQVTLLTSHPESIWDTGSLPARLPTRWMVQTYRTFDGLHNLLARDVAAVRLKQAQEGTTK